MPPKVLVYTWGELLSLRNSRINFVIENTKRAMSSLHVPYRIVNIRQYCGKLKTETVSVATSRRCLLELVEILHEFPLRNVFHVLFSHNFYNFTILTVTWLRRIHAYKLIGNESIDFPRRMKNPNVTLRRRGCVNVASSDEFAQRWYSWQAQTSC